MHRWIRQIERTVVSKGLLRDGQSILVAVSGGIDSMVLLHVFAALAPRHGWSLVAAHFNHGLRGKESDADELFVRKAAERFEIPCACETGNVAARQQTAGASREMAARTLRHAFLERTAAARGISTIALAHHADDQVELFFLRIFRGAAGALGGMNWIRPGFEHPQVSIIRPLLERTREEIRQFARVAKIKFREDSSNASLDPLRNRVRHRIIPIIREEFGEGALRTITRTMEIAGRDGEFVEDAAHEWLAGARNVQFQDLPVAMQRRIIRLQLEELEVEADFDRIEELRMFPSRPISVGARFLSRDGAGRIGIGEREGGLAAFEPGEETVLLTRRSGITLFGGLSIGWKKAPGVPGEIPAGLAGMEHFDAGKVGSRIVLRHWRAGDRFQPIGMKKESKLQDLFMNLKVPAALRRRIVVACTAAGEPFWVEGLRIAEGYKISATTTHWLKWRWRRI